MTTPTPLPPDVPSLFGRSRRDRLWIIAGFVVVIALIIAGGFLVAPDFTMTESPDSGRATASTSTAEARPPAKPGDCRDFTKDVTINGEARTIGGRACMRQDGSWQIVN